MFKSSTVEIAVIALAHCCSNVIYDLDMNIQRVVAEEFKIIRTE
jgi:hypothetical protein